MKVIFFEKIVLFKKKKIVLLITNIQSLIWETTNQLSVALVTFF